MEPQAREGPLRDYLGNWFIDPLTSGDWLRAGAYAAKSSAMMVFPFEWTGDLIAKRAIIASGLLGAGVWGMASVALLRWPAETRRFFAAWVVVPWCLMAAAACASLYPFGVPRMMVVAAPPVILAAAVGLIRAGRWVSHRLTGRRRPGAAAAMALAVMPLLYLSLTGRHFGGFVHHDFPLLLSLLKQERLPGEPVIATVEAVPCVRMYAGAALPSIQLMPVVGGTLPLRDFDYAGFATDWAGRDMERWWVLTVSRQASRDRDLLIEAARSRGYRAEIAAEAGTPGEFGVAQLIRMSR
jgi:hypothetical protein